MIINSVIDFMSKELVLVKPGNILTHFKYDCRWCQAVFLTPKKSGIVKTLCPCCHIEVSWFDSKLVDITKIQPILETLSDGTTIVERGNGFTHFEHNCPLCKATIHIPKEISDREPLKCPSCEMASMWRKEKAVIRVD